MSVSKDNKTGTWYCQYRYKDWRGIVHHTVKRGFKRKKDAEAYEHEHKSTIAPREINFDEVKEAFIEDMRTKVLLGNLKASTMASKQAYIDVFIKDYFDGVPIRNITTIHINGWLKDNVNSVKYSRRYSSGTLKLARSILNQIFRLAVKNYGLEKNPVEGSELPNCQSFDKREKLWTVEQFQTFYNDLDSDYQRLMYNALFWSGLRLGELFALTPADIVPYKISVSKSLVERYHGEESYITTPKNASSVREVEIPRFLYNQFIAYIERIPDMEQDTSIFGNKMSACRNTLAYKSKKLGLPVISPHILRHSYASLLYNLTHDITVVCKQLGHANNVTTLKVYSHMLPRQDRESVDMLEKLLPEKPVIDV